MLLYYWSRWLLREMINISLAKDRILSFYMLVSQAITTKWLNPSPQLICFCDGYVMHSHVLRSKAFRKQESRLMGAWRHSYKDQQMHEVFCSNRPNHFPRYKCQSNIAQNEKQNNRPQNVWQSGTLTHFPKNDITQLLLNNVGDKRQIHWIMKYTSYSDLQVIWSHLQSHTESLSQVW